MKQMRQKMALVTLFRKQLYLNLNFMFFEQMEKIFPLGIRTWIYWSLGFFLVHIHIY